MRIIYCDREAYLDKFRTCASVREFGNQKLGPGFYKREHTKPLFNQKSIINARNLYIYHCSKDILKILKFRIPMSFFELFELSDITGKQTRLITCYPSNNFLYTCSLIWNVVRELIKMYDFSIKVGPTI